MKIRISSRLTGNIMIACLIVTATVGIVLVGYLQLGQTSQRLSNRSQSWNLALPVAEAGMEEALTHLNYSRITNLACNGWGATTTTTSGNNGNGNGNGNKSTTTVYSRSRTLSPESYYKVGISSSATRNRTNAITIVSTGYFRDSLTTNYLSRTITGTVILTNFIWPKAIIARNHIKLGKGARVDSFDSLDSAYSLSGKYDPKKYKANASIATINDKHNAISIDSTKVYGDACTSHDGKGKKGDVQFKGSGTLGDVTWVNGGNKGAQDGKITHNYQYDFEPVEKPWSGGALPPTGGKLGKVDYQYILGTGNWELGKVSLKKPMIVTGNAVLYVTGDFKAEEDIIIDKGATLKLYMGGKKFEAKDKGMTMNDGDASQLQYFGLKSNKNFNFKKKTGAAFTGVIYAPNTRISIDGESDIIGSIVGKCVHIKHAGEFHYDEAIAKRPSDLDSYSLISWTE